MKAVFGGFLAGVAAVACVAVALRGRGEAPGGSVAEESRQAPSGAPSPAPPDLSPLRARAEALRAENARLAAALEPLRARAAAGTGRAGTPRRPRKEMGAELLGQFGDGGSRSWAVYNALMSELTLLAGEIADRDGVTVAEARMSPEMLEEVLLGMREASDPPAGEAEVAAMRAAVEAHRREWEALRAAGDDRMSFERMQAVLEAQERARTALFAAIDPAAVGRLAGALDRLEFEAWEVPSGSVGAPRAEAAPALARRWAEDLGLDASAATALVPAALEYIRDAEAAPDHPDDPAGHAAVRDALRELPRLAGAQRRIREVAQLTEEQAKRVAAWWLRYDVVMTDEEQKDGLFGGDDE